MQGGNHKAGRRVPVISRATEIILLLILLIIGGYCASVVASSRIQLWLAWAGLMPLIIAIRSLSVKGAMAAGALWGGSLFFFSIADSAATADPSLIHSLTFLIAPIVYTGLMGFYRRRFGFSPLAMALGIVFIELGLKGLGIGRSLLSVEPEYGPILSIVTDFLGYGFIAFIAAYTDAILLSIPWRICIRGESCDWFESNGNGARLAPPVFTYPAFSFYLKPSHPRAPPALTLAAP